MILKRFTLIIYIKTYIYHINKIWKFLFLIWIAKKTFSELKFLLLISMLSQFYPLKMMKH
jgi:hypothetical protein